MGVAYDHGIEPRGRAEEFPHEVEETGRAGFASEAERRRRGLLVELLEASRLTAMRELSQALLHQLNQPRSAMLNFTNATRRMLASGAPPETVLAALTHGVQEAERLCRIIEGLEDFVANAPVASADDLSAALKRVGREVENAGRRDERVRRLKRKRWGRQHGQNSSF